MSNSQLKVVHINFNSRHGGAAVAMQALATSLRSRNVESKVLALMGEPESDVIKWDDPFLNSKQALQRRFVWADRTRISNTEFSLDLFGVGLSQCAELKESDIIHLHWVAGFLSSRSLMEIALMGKPVFWTLHDIHPASGGCHYPAGCEKWQTGCGDCPQLCRDPFDLTRLQAAAMRRSIELLQPIFIAPSQWITGVALESFVSRDFPVHHVPYGVDTDFFRPSDRVAARNRLGLDQDSGVIYMLLSSQSFRENRKGFNEALQIYKQLSSSFRRTGSDKFQSIRLLICGELPEDIKLSLPPECVSIGFIKERDRLVDVYNASNLLLFTSLEDNLPNVLLEAAACGLPACAFPVGGVSDIVKDGVSGLHLDRLNIPLSASRILELINDSERLAHMSQAARDRAVKEFSLAGQADRIFSLYQRYLPISRSVVKSNTLPIEGAGVIAQTLNSGELSSCSVEAPFFPFLRNLACLLWRRFLKAFSFQAKQSFAKATNRYLTLFTAKIQKSIYQFDKYAPRRVEYENLPKYNIASTSLPAISLVTPSFNSAIFIAETIQSVISQNYPALNYLIQDGGSKDGTSDIVSRFLAFPNVRWISEPDHGQANAINKAFSKTSGEIMAWINADDLLAPGCLQFVGEFFSMNPDVDAIFGHRIVTNKEGLETSRWWSPQWDPKMIEYFDYVPQETFFWRRRIWEKLTPSMLDERFSFGMDWDLLARMRDLNAKIVRVPHFLGVFRVHELQKTNTLITTIGREEMQAIRLRYRESSEIKIKSNLKLVKNMLASILSKCAWKTNRFLKTGK
jgi:glycosyltransferase involved in cell wall biosynthesis